GANDAASTPAAGPTTAAAAAAAAASDLSVSPNSLRSSLVLYLQVFFPRFRVVLSKMYLLLPHQLQMSHHRELLRSDRSLTCRAIQSCQVPAFDKNDLYVSELGLDERYALCRGVAEECVQQDEELRRLLEVKPHPVCYDGFEPSGRMHIAQGVLRVININRLTRAGCVFKFWIADWFAQLNNKMGGDLKKIQTVGKYFIEIWQAMGMDMRNVQFLWASEEINRRPDEYWRRVMEIARLVSVRRITRCCTIMGRAESEDMPAAQIMYPAMQCADIFFLKADICQLGLDQRKVNMLAREYCDLVKPKIKHKPVILSHHMISGLKEGQAKMSKSDPDSAIFMEDLETDVNRKIKGAFCKPEMVEGNPILDYAKHILFGYFGEV
ncbi:unnamed protein product, partial [Phaeothamnion confervicola]